MLRRRGTKRLEEGSHRPQRRIGCEIQGLIRPFMSSAKAKQAPSSCKRSAIFQSPYLRARLVSELAIFCQAAPSLILAMSDTLITDSGPSFRKESDVVEHSCRPIEQQVRPTNQCQSLPLRSWCGWPRIASDLSRLHSFFTSSAAMPPSSAPNHGLESANV